MTLSYLDWFWGICNTLKKNEMHKAKGQVMFVYDDDWTLIWKISSGKNQNDVMNGDVLNLDFRTKTLTSKCGLLTNVLTRAIHFLMIIHNDEMWHYVHPLLVTWGYYFKTVYVHSKHFPK